MGEPRVIRDDVVNVRGELTFAEQTRMTRGPVWGAERLRRPEQPQERTSPAQAGDGGACSPGNENGDRATPDDDPWYDVPPGSPVLPTQWWQGVHPAHIDRFGVEPVDLPESWYRR